ncbi:hypothetical protein M5D96_005919 [Drosophila gunungcola]|uniref:Uncharacterized protein n=1 Tax=Drosophila gunungcola TaxID=103775 RepID=A0A9P9YS33_9MUSC|nr:hypothetical protein M5D96_005919 [Drosophila gunungcola]
MRKQLEQAEVAWRRLRRRRRRRRRRRSSVVRTTSESERYGYETGARVGQRIPRKREKTSHDRAPHGAP